MQPAGQLASGNKALPLLNWEEQPRQIGAVDAAQVIGTLDAAQVIDVHGVSFWTIRRQFLEERRDREFGAMPLDQYVERTPRYPIALAALNHQDVRFGGDVTDSDYTARHSCTIPQSSCELADQGGHEVPDRVETVVAASATKTSSHRLVVIELPCPPA